MFTLRCTQKLLPRLRLSVTDLRDAVTPASTTALGDWYANLVVVQRQHLIMHVSDRSRLCVLTSARDMDRLAQRFTTGLRQLLHDLEVPESLIERELCATDQMGYGLTTGTPNGRRVLGTMNDMTKALHHQDLRTQTLFDLNLYFSDWLCGPAPYQRPREVALELLTTRWSEKA